MIPFLSMVRLTVDSSVLGLKGLRMSRVTRGRSDKPIISLLLVIFVENLVLFGFSR